MNKKIFYAVFLLFFVSSVCAQYNILDYGAKKDQLSTSAIQEALDAAYENGGGIVVVPTGTFITGTLHLKSYTELHLQPGAVLKGSTNLDDYAVSFRRHGIILCEDQIQVSITGEGTIDAQGTKFYDPTQNHTYEEFNKQRTRQKENYMPEGEFYSDGPIKRLPKPGLSIAFFNCSEVTLRDFTLRDTPSWAVRIATCDDVTVTDISIKNNLMVPNSDGVHCTASRNITMSGCDIRAGDDAFIVTGFTMDEETPGVPENPAAGKKYGNKTLFAENVTVTNCLFQSRSSGIRVGYGQYPIRRCIFSNIVIYGSNRGIGIFAHDEADIEDLVFSNFIIHTRLHNGQWWGNGEPIHLSSITRFKNEPAGTIRNVQFNDIIATGEHGIILWGDKDSPMENISFENIDLKIVKGRETMTYGGNFDLRPAADIDMQLFEHDIPGIYARYVNDLSFEDIDLAWGEGLPAFFTHAIETENVNDLWIKDFFGKSNPSSGIKDSFLFKKSAMKKANNED